MNKRYEIGKIHNEKYPIWDTKVGCIIAECLNECEAQLIKTALNCYNFVVDMVTIK